METRIIQDYFVWIPEHERIACPPRRRDPRKAMLWIDSTSEFSDERRELNLVNNSEHPIELIHVFSEATTLVDDKRFTALNKQGLVYRNVEPGWGVKIDDFDDYYDLDHVIGFQILIESEKLGRFVIASSGVKGGHRRIEVLLWDTGETSRNFGLKHLSPHHNHWEEPALKP